MRPQKNVEKEKEIISIRYLPDGGMEFACILASSIRMAIFFRVLHFFTFFADIARRVEKPVAATFEMYIYILTMQNISAIPISF